MGGHGVSRERINCEHIEVLFYVTFQRETAISHDRIDLRTGARQKAELGTCQRDDERVDLIEGVYISRPAVDGERAGSKADYPDLQTPLLVERI